MQGYSRGTFTGAGHTSLGLPIRDILLANAVTVSMDLPILAALFGDPLVIEIIRACVAEEFDQVNDLIVQQLHSDVDMVENVGHYIIEAGGKRMRPLLVLLSAKALGQVEPAHVKFAAVVEFIHTATLLHDDVVDISSLRRGRATANEKFGNAPSVLVGDFIYTRAFQLMVQLGDLTLLDHMADTTNTIAEGEVLQLVCAGDPSVSEEQYLEVIQRKTAVLFAAACQGAAILHGRDLAQQHKLADFGMNLGVAFQMIDDVLDYTGDPEITGKQVGDDLNEGKPTLPLIYTMNTGSATDAEIVRSALKNKSAAQIDDVIAAVRRTGGIEYTQERALAHRNLSLQGLDGLSASPALDALEGLVDLSVNREK